VSPKNLFSLFLPPPAARKKGKSGETPHPFRGRFLEKGKEGGQKGEKKQEDISFCYDKRD